MRERFQRNLEQYGQIAKSELETEAEAADLGPLTSVIEWTTGQLARETASNPDAQRAIYDLQKWKQKVMDWLRTEIAKLDQPEQQMERFAGDRRIRYENGHLVWKHGRPHKATRLTLGELLTDGDWDIHYVLDPASVPRNIRKRFLIEQARRRLKELVNRQIGIQESSDERNGQIRTTYRQTQEQQDAGEWQGGKILERMVKNFLKKLSIDHGLDFEIIEGDLFQDISQKIDFIIRRKIRRRGVRIEEASQKSTIGIQFTTIKQANILEHKQRQIENAFAHLGPESTIEDIILVKMQVPNLKKKFEDWRYNAAAPPGGPDKFLNRDLMARVFRRLMKDFLAPEEIATGIQLIRGHREQMAKNAGRKKSVLEVDQDDPAIESGDLV